MVTQERIGSPESCSDIFCIHNISPTKSIANQSLSNHSPFVSSRNEKDRCVTRRSGCMGRETNSLRAQPVMVSSRKAPPHKEALRDKTKGCCTGLTRRHKKIVIGIVNTKSSYCYKSLLLIIWYDKSSHKRAKKKITKKQSFRTLRFTICICRILF